MPETSRRGNAYQSALILLIFFIILAIGFAGLAYTKAEAARQLRDGGPEVSRPVRSLLEQTETLRKDIERLNDQAQALYARRTALDMDLAQRLAHQDPATGIWRLTRDEAGRTPWQRTREQAAHSLRSMEQKRASLESPEQQQAYRPLEQTTRSFQDQTNATLVASNEASARLTADRDRLHERREAIEDRKKAFIDQHNDDSSSLQTRRTQFEARIRELLELELSWLTELEADGQVLEVTSDRRFVVVDIGAADGAQLGLRLEVFGYPRGQYTSKGLVEIIELDQRTATCRVVEEVNPRLNPITRNDRVGNPIFQRHRQPIVVLAGEFQRYNRRDLAAFIRRAGGEVRDRLGPDTELLIAGDRSEPQRDEARQYQVVAMTEDQLLRYLDTTFRPQKEQ